VRQGHGATLAEAGPAGAKPSRRGRESLHTRWHSAWLLLTLALAGHVLDEALTDFLGVYNPAVEAIRESLPWLPLPTFTFETWIAGLVIAVLGLAALAPLVRNGRTWMRGLSRVYGGVMALNGLGHLGGSLLLGRWLPGVVSSPFLLGAAIFLLVSVPRPTGRLETGPPAPHAPAG
jgi:hypothetical protein